MVLRHLTCQPYELIEAVFGQVCDTYDVFPLGHSCSQEGCELFDLFYEMKHSRSWTCSVSLVPGIMVNPFSPGGTFMAQKMAITSPIPSFKG